MAIQRPVAGAVTSTRRSAQTLAGAAAGTAVGGLAGALIGLGIPENDVNRFVGRVQEGCAFIAVRVDDSEMASRARNVFESSGASDVNEVGIENAVGEKEKKIA